MVIKIKNNGLKVIRCRIQVAKTGCTSNKSERRRNLIKIKSETVRMHYRYRRTVNCRDLIVI